MGFLINPYRFAAGATEFDSMYESFNPLTTVNKQHFVEWFSGSALDSIWTQTDVAGTGTFAMDDTVDGGFKITTGASGSNESNINFNNKRQYEETACVCIAVWKTFATSLQETHVGLSANITSYPVNSAALYVDNGGNFNIRTADGSTSSQTSTGTAVDTNFHSYKIECKSADIEMSVDGVKTNDKTTNRPTIPMQPFSAVRHISGGAQSTSTRYMECYNT